MARFLISPGVLTRELDQSQYAATTPGTGNLAALVGYAEKGPFEPTIVNGIQDFNQKFGFTIKDAPYLAQAAYKYFQEGDQALIVRAGDNSDPEINASAAQIASKTIRVNPLSEATVGYQSFKAINNIASGTYTINATYGFRVKADFRGFESPKYLESWSGSAVETENSFPGVASPTTNLNDLVFKIAGSSSSSTVFDSHLKRDNGPSTAYFYGKDEARKTGTSFGSTVYSKQFQYFRDGAAYDSNDDWIEISGAYGAAVVGTTNLIDGKDYEATPAAFDISINGVASTITLDTNCANTDEIVTLINNKFTADSVGAVAGKMTPILGTNYIYIKKTTATGTGFELEGAALTGLGISVGTYNDSTCISGTWHAETVMSGSVATFDGEFIFKLIYTNETSTTFEDVIDVSLTSPVSGEWTLTQIESQINDTLTDAYSQYHYPESRAIASYSNNKITISTTDVASEGFKAFTEINVPDPEGGALSLITLLGGIDVAVNGVIPDIRDESIVYIKAKEKGTHGNDLTLRVETKIINYGLTQATQYNAYVLWRGNEVSVYQKVDWSNPESSNYILTRMANDKYVTIESIDENDDNIHAKLPDGYWTLGNGDLPDGVLSEDAVVTSFTVGSNGWATSEDTITSMSADFTNALAKLYNPEVYDFNLVAAPGGADAVVQNAVQSLCDSRRDCFGVIDAAPFGIGLDIENKEGNFDITDVNAACSTITSSYAGAFWPWLQDYDSDNQQYLWLPPSIYALKQMVYTDNVSDPWMAPAGMTRGRVTALGVEYSPTRLDRDILYGETNIVNPIVNFVNEGITIWGQKTGQRTLSATNRINVRRLLIYAEKLVARMARTFLFEPNDAANYSAFTRQANAILEPIRQRRGLNTYQVICDESTNTPEIVEQNIMVGKIFIQPTKTIEFIEVEFTITAQGDVTIDEG